MKTIPFFRSSILVVGLFFLCTAQKCDDLPKDFSIHYKSHTSNIQIINKVVNYIETKYKYDHPASATPSGSTIVKKVTNVTLSDKQAADLLAFIKASEFDQLKDAYGAPEDQRYYPYSMTVTVDKQAKKVIYRSNPSYKSMPPAFKKVEQYLFELMKTL